MKFLELLNQNFPFSTYWEFLLRLIAACGCGAIIGLERTKRQKAAGIRTHCLIAATGCLLMILSKYSFADLSYLSGDFVEGIKGADPSRIASQVVSGVTFLGAGVIFVKGGSVKGLTTAAGIWATSAVGMTIGAGMYLLGIFFTFMVVGLQVFLHKLNVGDDAFSTHEVLIEMKDTIAMRDALREIFEAHGVQVFESKISREAGDYISLRLSVKMTRNFSYEETLAFMDAHPDIRTMQM